MKYAVVTFGCRVNQADSLRVEEDLLAAGALPSDADHADVVVVNTCSVTASADQAARQTIRRLARLNPQARLLVTGCYATRRPGDLAALPGVARIVANDRKPELIRIIRDEVSARGLPGASPAAELSTAERFGEGDGACGAAAGPGLAGRTAFTLRVQTGCAERCAYCIIPTTRGQPRSRGIPEVIRDIDRAAAAGYKEIVLTGVHLGSFGRDLQPARSLDALLGAIADRWAVPEGSLPGLLFRISSLEPMDCTGTIVELVGGAGCFAPHFHLPLQHASNDVLRAMRRPYTIEAYRDLVDGIRGRLPHASLGTDVIAGFPGERDADAGALVAYLESSPLTHVHVFPYSDRPGTEAAARPDKVPGQAVRERARRVREAGLRLAAAFRESQAGAVRPGLTIDDGATVVTDNYLKVRIPQALPRNEWVTVRVTDPGPAVLRGEVAAPPSFPI